MNWVFRVLDIGHVRGRNPARIRPQRNDVVEDARDGHGRENDGVYDPRRGHETEPLIYEDEDGREVYVCDRQNDDAYGQRELQFSLH